MGGVERLVDLAPVHLARASGVVSDKLVAGGAARVLAGADDQRAVVGQDALAALDGLFHQGRHGQVVRIRGPRGTGQPGPGADQPWQRLLSAIIPQTVPFFPRKRRSRVD